MNINTKYLWEYILPNTDRFFGVNGKSEDEEIDGNEEKSIVDYVEAKPSSGVTFRISAAREPMPENPGGEAPGLEKFFGKKGVENSAEDAPEKKEKDNSETRKQRDKRRLRYTRVLPLEISIDSMEAGFVRLALKKPYPLHSSRFCDLWFYGSKELRDSGASLWLETSKGDILLEADCGKACWTLCKADTAQFHDSYITGIKLIIDSGCNAVCYIDSLRVGSLRGFKPVEEEKVYDGKVFINPQRITSGEDSKIEVVYQTERDYERGSALKLVTPALWILQDDDINRDYYCCAYIEANGLKKKVSVLINPKWDTRWRRETEIFTEEDILKGGRFIWEINNIAWDEDKRVESKDFRVYIKENGRCAYSIHNTRPVLEIAPLKRSGYRLALRQKSSVRNAGAYITSIDENGNTADSDCEPVEVSFNNLSNNESAVIKAPMTNGKSGILEVPSNSSLYQVSILMDKGRKLKSNVIDLSGNDYRPYFGYIHGHSSNSEDGRQNLEYCYRFGRDNALLDFCSITDHFWSHEPMWKWEYMLECSSKMNRNGEFVTIPGYEWSSQDHGDRNVYFMNEDEALPCELGPIESTPSELYEQLTGKNALIIPHSTAYEVRARGINWNYYNPQLERLVEIYSAHGSSETTAGNRFLLDNVTMYPHIDQNTVQAALERGCRVGFIAGGDDHTRPLPKGSGIFCVWAEDCTRESIWKAMYNRRCYGTTGARIVVDFNVNGCWMGSEVRVERLNAERNISFRVLSDIPVHKIELIKNRSCTHLWYPPDNSTLQLRGEWTDTSWILPNEYFYLRVFTTDSQVAWSSPVWVNAGEI